MSNSRQSRRWCRGVHCGGRTHSEQPGRRLHTPCSSRHNRGSHPAFHRRRSLRPQVSLRSTQRGRYRERRDCDSPSSLRGRSSEKARPQSGWNADQQSKQPVLVAGRLAGSEPDRANLFPLNQCFGVLTLEPTSVYGLGAVEAPRFGVVATIRGVPGPFCFRAVRPGHPPLECSLRSTRA